MSPIQTFYQVRANALVVYSLPAVRHGKRFQLDTPGLTTYSGKVTGHAKKRLLAALDILVQKSKERVIYNPVSRTKHDFKMSFITLTIASKVNLEVTEAYDKLLREWLRYMKRKMGMEKYVWKAEYQRRGQVHYHIATDNYIPWETIRWRWNQLQRRAGLLDEFASRFRHFNPNSTDVHSMQNVHDCLAYIGKEMCKDVQNQKVTKGKIWDCSTNLKIGRFSANAEWELFDNIDDAVQHGFATIIETDHCKIIKCKEPLKLIPEQHLSDYRIHIS